MRVLEGLYEKISASPQNGFAWAAGLLLCGILGAFVARRVLFRWARSGWKRRPSLTRPRFPTSRTVLIEKAGARGGAQPCSTNAEFRYHFSDMYLDDELLLGVDPHPEPQHGIFDLAEKPYSISEDSAPAYVHPEVPDELPLELWLPEGLQARKPEPVAARPHGEPAPGNPIFQGSPVQEQYHAPRAASRDTTSQSTTHAATKQEPAVKIAPLYSESSTQLWQAPMDELESIMMGDCRHGCHHDHDHDHDHDHQHGNGHGHGHQHGHSQHQHQHQQGHQQGHQPHAQTQNHSQASGFRQSATMSYYSPPVGVADKQTFNSPPEMFTPFLESDTQAGFGKSGQSLHDFSPANSSQGTPAMLPMRPGPYGEFTDLQRRQFQGRGSGHQYLDQKRPYLKRDLQVHTHPYSRPPAPMAGLPSPPHSARGGSESGSDTNEEHMFKCSHCPATFRIRGYLTRHMKKHAEIMKFNCPFHKCLGEDHKCHQTGGFSRRDTFKMHLKARHFLYPNGTSRKNRPNCAGRCCGCSQVFENNEVWIESHLLAGLCPMDKVHELHDYDSPSF